MGDLLSAVGDVGKTIGGPLVAGGLNLLGGLMQNQGQVDSIKSQEEFQDKESSSAYQRSVADMKEAGLNPALMYGSGGPESTPSGASMMPPNILGGVAGAFTDTMSANKTQEVQSAQIALQHLEALTSSAKLPLFQAEGDFVKSLTPAMHSLEKFLSNSAKGVGDAGKVLSQSADSAFGLAGDAWSWLNEADAGIDSFGNYLDHKLGFK